MDFKTYYSNQQKLVEDFLKKRIAKKGISKVDDAMEYSLMAGGKRIRPILLMAAAEACGKKGYSFLPVACGLEMIHTYSLIHDDLPCMDDDDYRRGRLTNHKVFGEAMAVLAGDGLLTLAFEVMLEQKNVPAEVLVETVREMAMCAGNFGMVGGQVLDLDAEGKQITAEEMRKMHAGKTGALFIAAVRGGAHLAGASDQELRCLTKFADLLGLAFQITDDILDVEGTEEQMGKTLGKDSEAHKSTFVSILGLEKARALANNLAERARESLQFFGEKANILNELLTFILERKR